MGYHIASELLADKEYQIIDEEVWFKHPDEKFRNLVKRGRKNDGSWYGQWSWITAHGHYGKAENDEGYGVEHDHWLDAIEAIELALKYRPEGISEDKMLALVKEGMQKFKNSWTEFFTIVLNEVNGHLEKIRP